MKPELALMRTLFAIQRADMTMKVKGSKEWYHDYNLVAYGLNGSIRTARIYSSIIQQGCVFGPRIIPYAFYALSAPSLGGQVGRLNPYHQISLLEHASLLAIANLLAVCRARTIERNELE